MSRVLFSEYNFDASGLGLKKIEKSREKGKKFLK